MALLALLALALSHPAPCTTPGARALAVADDGGGLALLDPVDGTAWTTRAGRVRDVLSASPGELWTVEADGQTEGRLARHHVLGKELHAAESVPFGAEDGHLVDGGDAPVAYAFGMGGTLARFDASGGHGMAWPALASVAVRVTGEGREVIGLFDGGMDGPLLLPRAQIEPLDVSPLPARALVAPWSPCGARLLVLGDGLGAVGIHDGLITLSRADADGAAVVASARAWAPADCVEDAAALPDGSVVALLGPAPTLVRLHPDGATTLALPGPPLSHSPWPQRRLAVDAARGRVWTAAGGLFAVTTGGGGLALERALAVPAHAISAVRAPSTCRPPERLAVRSVREPAGRLEGVPDSTSVRRHGLLPDSRHVRERIDVEGAARCRRSLE